MFCSKCGNKIEENHEFCSKCGNRILSMPIKLDDMLSQAAPLNIHNTTVKKASSKKYIIGLCVALGIVLVIGVVCGIISRIVPKRVDFDLKFDRVEIQEFMDVVCENSDVESAQVGRVGVDGAGISYGNYISATVTIKPHNMLDEEIEVRFYNSGDTDEIASIVVYYHSYDSENVIVCKNAIVEALEISFCGSSSASPHTAKFDSIGTDLTIYDDAQILTNYSLTGEANVRISCDGSFSNDWTGTYCIYKN